MIMILFTYLCSKICLLLNTPARLARHWGAGVIHAGSRRGYLKKKFRIELFMVDKGFGGRQYQKTTLASNPKRDYVLSVLQFTTWLSLWYLQTSIINASLTLHILISKNISVLSWRQELLISGDNPNTWRTTKCTSQCKLTIFEGLKTRPAV